MLGEHREAGRALSLVLLGLGVGIDVFHGPERNGAPAVLGEPRLELGLGGFGRQVGEVEDLGALGQEDLGVVGRVVRLGQHQRVGVERQRLLDQLQQHLGVHAHRQHQVVGRILAPAGRHRHVQRGDDVGQGRRRIAHGLRVGGLPLQILVAQVKHARVLQIHRQHHGLVAGLARKQHPEAVEVDGDKRKVLARHLGHEFLVELGDGIFEQKARLDVVPLEVVALLARGGHGGVGGFDQHRLPRQNLQGFGVHRGPRELKQLAGITGHIDGGVVAGSSKMDHHVDVGHGVLGVVEKKCFHDLVFLARGCAGVHTAVSAGGGVRKTVGASGFRLGLRCYLWGLLSPVERRWVRAWRAGRFVCSPRVSTKRKSPYSAVWARKKCHQGPKPD